jgi:hypothetical protein
LVASFRDKKVVGDNIAFFRAPLHPAKLIRR